MTEPVTFLTRAEAHIGTERAAVVDAALRRLSDNRHRAEAEFPAMAALKTRSRAIRLHALSHLDRLLGHLVVALEEAGSVVHFAGDADEANELILHILRQTESRRVVKAKSMLTEEIGLNEALKAAGVEVTETDLGEFIVQMAADAPSHIIAPVLHLTRGEVGDLFAENLDVPRTDDPQELNSIARAHLRTRFLEADAGITGVNLAVAESGSLVLVTNEGNGSLVAAAPRIHIAVLGLERVVARWEDAAVVLEVLSRSATGQRLTSYTDIITGPRSEDEPDGPDELHVVIVDNGRTQTLASPTAEILACIRCGACLNVCPVFRSVGGHTYGSVYSGPIGSVVTPSLHGLDPWWELPFASTLCGACEEACPVGIQIPSMLVALRQQAARQGRLPGWLDRGVRRYSRVTSDPEKWQRAKKWARILSGPISVQGFVRKLPGPGRNWTDSRDLRRPAAQSFSEWWRSNRGS